MQHYQQLPWYVPPVAPAEFRAANSNLHPALVQYLWNYNFTDPSVIKAIFEYTVPYDTNPSLLKDMDKATTRIKQAIDNQETVYIYGDYDADGITSTSLLYMALRNFGLQNLTPFVPGRHDGYGISEKVIQREMMDADLIITVDNGITAHAPIKWASEQGIDVIVTDHHSVDTTRMPVHAVAIVNPKQDDCCYFNVDLCGAGVAYKLCQALEVACNCPNVAEQFLDLVAIGTIADMMRLDSFENRNLVVRGLELLNNNPRIGIRALAQLTNMTIGKIDANTIGFTIGPAINAAGRVEHPKYAMYLLTTSSEVEAAQWAKRLVTLNETRKDMLHQAVQEELSRLEQEDTSREAMPIIIRQIPDCPEGIVGLIAGSLNNAFDRPSIVLKRSVLDDGSIVWGGSCRSVASFDISQALRDCDDLLIRHGGHGAAAGLTVADDKVDELKARLKQLTLDCIDLENRPMNYMGDMVIPLSFVSESLVNVMKALEPTGGLVFPEPKFIIRNLKVVEHRTMGAGDKHLALTVADDSGNTIRAVGWRMGNWAKNMPAHVDLSVNIGISEFRGRHVELTIRAIQDTNTPEGVTVSAVVPRQPSFSRKSK